MPCSGEPHRWYDLVKVIAAMAIVLKFTDDDSLSSGNAIGMMNSIAASVTIQPDGTKRLTTMTTRAFK